MDRARSRSWTKPRAAGRAIFIITRTRQQNLEQGLDITIGPGTAPSTFLYARERLFLWGSQTIKRRRCTRSFQHHRLAGSSAGEGQNPDVRASARTLHVCAHRSGSRRPPKGRTRGQVQGRLSRMSSGSQGSDADSPTYELRGDGQGASPPFAWSPKP